MPLKQINSLNDLDQYSEYKKDLSPVVIGERRFFNVKNAEFNFELEVTEDLKFVTFENCTFNKPLKFKNLDITNNFDFKKCKFIDDVEFINVKVNEKSRFWESDFQSNAEFNNVSFKDLADFFKAKFKQIIIFYKVDFFSTTVFTEATFDDNVLFTYSKIADVIIFTRTSFKAGLDLSQAIITGQVNIHNSDLKNFADVPDIEDNDQYRDAIETNGVITRNNKRETYRILKKFSKEDYNQFKYLEYSKLENEVYFKQLKENKWKRFNNYVIFLLNKFSNDHNMSWLIGFVFTSSIGFLFFYLSLISTYCIEIGWEPKIFVYYLGLYFQFLSPLHSNELFINEYPNTGTIILDFFGRIFVGYGIYQTVQAFRKHKG